MVSPPLSISPGFWPFSNPRRCYNILRPPPAIRDAFLRTLKVPVLLFWGKWGTFVPLEGRVPLMAVYGTPIEARTNVRLRVTSTICKHR